MITNKDKELLNLVVAENGKIIPSRSSEKYLKAHGWYDYVMNRYTDNISGSIREIIYRMINDIETSPKCKMCGKPVIFSNQSGEYSKWCSKRCQNDDPEMKAINAAKVSEYRKWEYANKKEEVMAKKAATLKEHFGEDSNGSPFCCKAVQDKRKETCLEKYGTENYIIKDEERRKGFDVLNAKNKQMWAERGLDVDYTDHKTVIVHNCCEIHGEVEMDIWDFNNRMKPERIAISPLCPICNPFNTSNGLEDFVRENLDKCGLTDYRVRDRSTILHGELDVHFPERKIAFEINGTYYHSDKHLNDICYHINKTDKCESVGIRVLHLWEPFIRFRKDIIINEVKRVFDILSVIEPVSMRVESPESATDFFENNSVYGYKQADKHVSLIDSQGDVLSMISFSILEDNIIDIINYHDKMDVVCNNSLGIFVDLLKRKNPSKITYSLSRDLYDNKLIESVGFKQDKIYLNTRFFYGSIQPSKRKVIVEISEDEFNNPDSKNRYHKCHDSGLITYSLIP